MNRAVICLIPKKAWGPLFVNDYKSIFLVHIIPKLIAKVITTYLRLLLLNCIDNTQTTIFPGLQLHDNTSTAWEILYHSQMSPKPTLSTKVDFIKAIDKLDRGFIIDIRQVLYKSRFSYLTHNLQFYATEN